LKKLTESDRRKSKNDQSPPWKNHGVETGPAGKTRMSLKIRIRPEFEGTIACDYG
jgi:hypothetical protein